MKEWHFGTAYELISDVVGDQTALICDGVTRTWSEYDDRSARLAGFLFRRDSAPKAKWGFIFTIQTNTWRPTTRQ